jgi:hypothetical protein
MSGSSNQEPAPISEGPSSPSLWFHQRRDAAWHILQQRTVRQWAIGVLVGGLAVVLVAWWAFTPGGSASRIAKVLAAERDLYQQMEASITPLDTHWDASGAAARYASGLSRIDTTDCPDDFQLVFLKYVQAWTTVVREKRSNSWAGLIIRGFLFGKEKGAALGEVDEALKRAQQEWFEVERLALKYRTTLAR